MTYTINQVAKLSGVSSRTLRFYDQIGLLAPAFYGENQYRYYKEEQLLLLQQILFFRELGYPLNEIQRILSASDFDKIHSLKTHKSKLQTTLERTAVLIKTIDKTISHLSGKIIMRDAEIYEGFDPIKQQEHEQYMIETGILSQKQIDASWQRAADWKRSDWEEFKSRGERLNLGFTAFLEQGLKSDSKEVQQLVQQHYDWVRTFWTPTKPTYLALAQMYLDHPDYRLFYDRYDAGLAEYLVAAMKIFADGKLSSLI